MISFLLLPFGVLYLSCTLVVLLLYKMLLMYTPWCCMNQQHWEQFTVMFINGCWQKKHQCGNRTESWPLWHSIKSMAEESWLAWYVKHQCFVFVLCKHSVWSFRHTHHFSVLRWDKDPKCAHTHTKQQHISDQSVLLLCVFYKNVFLVILLWTSVTAVSCPGLVPVGVKGTKFNLDILKTDKLWNIHFTFHIIAS